ncbi:CaiB/BaiF CoA transferase family protein [Bordetella hinzii]|uniref:CoA-transferase family III protein n=1 Tax=Bordetella hinzii OH87 BAL007II TaxID=1331262 RepID=A0ABR4R0D7_9BORD|nr:CaiB/BaiF CoA-transferase family protein [Bordetella hinzii]KCB23721.1 CoA-transferase family III protein [Bordetella hinzii OH87 BAL007II]KCB43225.1 CoA-transferase family III protein [Bordetella hinzii 5132]QDJ44166.1 CoA transferase [Bordetella hinzii]QDJ55742.1 CoA transferase [Bordetella hinzii]
MMFSPLKRFVVLDLSRVRSGPAAVRQFADWGADVIKIEEPSEVKDDKPGGAAKFSDYQNTHRNKRSLTLNLKHPEGRAVFLELVKRADVLVENYRPSVKAKLGIDYASLSRINPGLVYASISGFGQDGPYADRPGLDQIAQGLGGLMSVTGEAGRGPMRAGIPIADLSAGLFAAIGILIALLDREQTGKGRWVQTSLLQSQIWMMDFQATRWLIDGEVPGQSGNDHPTSSPTGVYPTADGYINIAAMGSSMFARLCEVLEMPALAEDPRFASAGLRVENRAALNAEIVARTRRHGSAEWIERLNAAGVPCGPILGMDGTFENEQVRHLKVTRRVAHPQRGEIDILAQPVIFGDTEPGPLTPAPETGAHTDDILLWLGLDEAARGRLRAVGAV